MISHLLAIIILSTAQTIVIDHLNDTFNGKEIELRGFLYKNHDDQFILAKVPNLKTCCLDSKKKDQVIIIGEINTIPTSQAITLRGTFDSSNQYTLYNSKVITQSKTSIMPLIVFALMIVGSGILYQRYRLNR